jgi:hypothetical protein
MAGESLCRFERFSEERPQLALQDILVFVRAGLRSDAPPSDG